MSAINKLNNNKIFYFLFFVSIFLTLPRWLYSFINFDIDIYLRIIAHTSDNAFYPLIKFYSELNLTTPFDDNKIISFPIFSILFNSIFYKVFGVYSFLILETLCLFIFLIIFYFIFIELGINKKISIIFSIFLLIVKYLIIDLNYLNLEHLKLLSLNFESFYDLRFPRPIITNLYFYAFILFALKFFNEKTKYNKYFIIFPLLMGISFNAFYYFFFIESFFILIILIIKFKKNLFNFISFNKFRFLFSILILLLFFFIFRFQIYLSEVDYINRLGIFKIDSNNRSILINYLFSFLSGIEFLELFLLSIILLIFSRDSKVSLFFYLFLSTIFATMFFFIFSPQGIDLYHFFNWIVITGFLFILLSLLIIFNNNIINRLNKKFYNLIYPVSLVLIIFYFNYSQIQKINASSINTSSNKVLKFIEKENIFIDKNVKILVFNYDLSLWLILKGYNNLSLVPTSFWTSEKDTKLESDLFSSLKFLNFDKDNFINLIKNKKTSWRYKNNFVYMYFGRKYMANNANFFNNDINDFSDDEKKFIKKSNILISHQIIIPKLEFKRMIDKFNKHDKEINPDIVIIENNKFNNFLNNNYCKIFDDKKFKIFSKIKINTNCIN